MHLFLVEIGNTGLYHDSKTNSCKLNKFIELVIENQVKFYTDEESMMAMNGDELVELIKKDVLINRVF